MAPDITADETDRRRRRRDIGKARPKGVVPHLPDPEDLELNCEWLTRAFKPPAEYTFEAFHRASQRRIDSCTITFRNGSDRRKFRFDEQDDLRGTGAKIRANVDSIGGGWLRMPLLSAPEASDLWSALCRVGQILEHYDERDETRKWLEQLLDVATPLRGYTLADPGPTRHDALMALRAAGEFKQADAIAMGRTSDWVKRPTRLIDRETGEQWIRANETFYFAKHVCGSERVDRGKLTDRVAAIGVTHRKFEHHFDPHPKATLYQLTDALIEYVGDPPEPAGDPQTTLNGGDKKWPF